MTRTNPILLQAFAWDLPADASHWRLLSANAELLADTGITAAWLPPAYKGRQGIEDVGYGVYDMFDLGEFDQCGSVPTKYGTRSEYVQAVQALQAAGVDVMADVVLNHRMGADATEQVRAVRVDPQDRRRVIGEPEEITAWTRFTFPARAGAYSDFTWDWTCFKATDWDEATGRTGLWLFEGKEWNPTTAQELGSYDYLMGADVHVTKPRVRAELDRWGQWFVEVTGVRGLRLDAVKHIGSDFMGSWLSRLREATGEDLPAVGEYWSARIEDLEGYLLATADPAGNPVLSLFDVALQNHLHLASVSHGEVDLSRLFEDTLVGRRPEHAVTFVDNHDTQPHQALEATVEAWFKPSAYALILLREAGLPCVFWGDLFGTPETGDLAAVPELPLLMLMRRLQARGPQHDAFDEPDVVGFSREGQASRPESGLAVVLSDRHAGSKELYVGHRHAGRTWVRVIGDEQAVGPHEPGQRVVVSPDGVLAAQVDSGGLSVYVPEAALAGLEHRWSALVRPR